MDQFALAYAYADHFRDTDDKITKTAFDEAPRDPENDRTPYYPATSRMVDAILANSIEATADSKMRLPAAGVAGTTIPPETISVSESLCADPLLNRVKWEFYLPSHRHKFITRMLSEMAKCLRVALETRHPLPIVATSAGSKASESLPLDSTSAPADPESAPSVVAVLCNFATMAWRDFSELARGAWMPVACCAVIYICIASFCTRTPIQRRTAPGGRFVLAVLAVPMLLQLFSTVGAAKPRPFRDATSNVWAEGKPSARSDHAMSAGPDGSLDVFGGLGQGGATNDLFKLDLDTNEWHTIEPRGLVKPSARTGHGMVSVGSDLYVIGGVLAAEGTGEEGLCDDGHRRGACQIERLGDAPRAAAVLIATSCARAGCHAVPHQGLVTLDGTSPLSWHRESQRGRVVKHIHIER
jgi:hypothetical protein